MEPPRPRLKKKMGRSASIRSVQSSDPGQRISADLKCCGILHGNAVVVTLPHHIKALVRNGCFGKGIFSRSIPSWSQVAFQDGSSQGRGSVQGKTENQSKRIKLEKEEESEEDAQISMQTECTPSDLPPLASTLDATLSSTISACSKEAGAFQSDRSDPIESTVCSREHPDLDSVQQATVLVERLRDPPGVTEYLQLSSEEAFYLAYEVELLDVQSSLAAEKVYTPCELWSCFCERDEHFVERYIAYRHYRHHGWVPKSGLKFGVDFLLYKDGPAFYHSSYAVVVRMVDHLKDLEPVCESADGGLTWHYVISLCRVNESAVKDLLICYVIKPSNWSKEELQSPSCVSKFSVEEMFVNRWVPDRERD